MKSKLILLLFIVAIGCKQKPDNQIKLEAAPFTYVKLNQDTTTMYNCLLIGKNSGLYLTNQHHVIVIREFKNGEKQPEYKNFQIDIDPDFGYFRTDRGKYLLGYINGYLETKALRDTNGLLVSDSVSIEYLKAHIALNYLPDIERWFKNKK